MEQLKPGVRVSIRHTRADCQPTSAQAARTLPSHPERLGDYQILRVIGEGGMGIVYEAEHESLKNRVALKVMHPRFRTDPTYLRRFHTEARSAARLHHTNIVPVFDYGEHDGICYYAMPLIAGVGLHQVLDDVRRLRATDDPTNAPEASGQGEQPATEPVAEPVMGRHPWSADRPVPDWCGRSRRIRAAPDLGGCRWARRRDRRQRRSQWKSGPGPFRIRQPDR